MTKNDYQYALELRKEDGTPLGQVSVTVDWEPAQEWARFAAIRKGQLPAGEASRVISIQPIWHATAGEPYVRGFRVSVSANGCGEVSSVFTTAYFRELAQQASSQFVETGKLAEGERFVFLAAAYPRHEERCAEPASESKVRFTAKEIVEPLPLKDTTLEEFVPQGLSLDEINAEEMPALVPQHVLDEAAALSRQAGPKETGGILIGHLHRDPNRGEIFAEITAQIPAQHVQAELTRLTFTAETWTEVRAALALRRKNEFMLGWWHSHPLREWCKECPVERQKACKLAGGFFSAHDHALHRAVFPRAYSVALVVNDLAVGDPTFSLFGWRQGLLELRGFHVLGASRLVPGVEAAPQVC